MYKILALEIWGDKVILEDGWWHIASERRDMSQCLSVTSHVVSCAVPVGNVSCMLFKEGRSSKFRLTHCGRVAQICVFNTVKLGTSASSP